jgi:Sec-independent protein translocase protein TatA
MDILVALVIILVIVVLWRGPRTLPQIGGMFGRGFRSARDEAERMRTTSSDPAATPPDPNEKPQKPA